MSYPGFCSNPQSCCQPHRSARNNLLKCGFQKEVTLKFATPSPSVWQPLLTVVCAHSGSPLPHTSISLHGSRWISFIGCQNWKDSRIWSKKTVGVGESHKSIKLLPSATLGQWTDRAAAVTAHLGFVLVYFGLKIMSHENMQLRHHPPLHYTQICKWKAKL